MLLQGPRVHVLVPYGARYGTHSASPSIVFFIVFRNLRNSLEDFGGGGDKSVNNQNKSVFGYRDNWGGGGGDALGPISCMVWF